jgi:hypothetical protein
VQTDEEACSPQIGPQRCAEIAEAYEQAKKGKGSETVQAGECPPALSREACEEAGQVAAPPANGPTVQPGECPPVMTAAQCADLRQAYAEAAR